MAVKLTEKSVKAAKPGKNVIRLRDSVEPGLCLVIAPSGTKTFSYQFTSPEMLDINKKTGEQRMRYGKPLHARPYMKLGTDSLKDARQKARDLRAIVDSGVCPIQEELRKAGAAMVATQQPTVAALFHLYKKDLEMDGKATKDMLDAYRLDIEPFMATQVANTVTKYDIADVLSTIVERGAIRKADMVRGYLHRAFNLGLKAPTSLRWRKKAPDFKLEYNPVSVVEKAGKSTPGTRNLSAREVERLWNELGVNNMHKENALAVKLILSTGQRVQEVLSAKWAEFDLDEGVWSLPFERRKIRHKANHAEPHLIPLAPVHIKLLKELQGITGTYKWLFPDALRKGPRSYNALHLAVKRYCHPDKDSKRKGFEHFSPRDLRRTFKTLSGQCGLSKEIRDRLQGHAFQDVGSKNYDRYDYWIEKQAAMVTWARWLDNVVKGQKANVVLMKEAS